MTYLDTHVVVWLFHGEPARLSSRARALLDDEADLLISPMMLLEIAHLREIGRFRYAPDEVADSLARELGLRVCDLPFLRVVRSAIDQTWTRDPFDRVVVGQSAARGAPLLTKDETILEHYDRAVW